MKNIEKLDYDLITWSWLNWLAGFFEGEGCILMRISKSKTCNFGYRITPMVSINQCDYEILYKIKDFLETQKIDTNIIYECRSNPNHKDSYSLQIWRRYSVKKFFSLIYPYLLGKKIKQVEILLFDIFPLIEQNKHLTKKGFLEVMGYIDQLNSLKGGKRGKYNQKYFIHLFTQSSQ